MRAAQTVRRSSPNCGPATHGARHCRGAAPDPRHSDADLALRSPSRHAGLSERHFSRLFRAQVGMSPREHVERVRVAVASRLLIETACNPDARAREAGFGMRATMNHAFLRGAAPDLATAVEGEVLPSHIANCPKTPGN
ncbi:helix-turn-helix domain-containing protein [Streptomyces sp. NPDC006314]|uniref:helix-turn-helix domain-containing protein n=1 Tax=Streptomyces sp. NPDC006314 TaxID=3154475 RepID=UPI00339F3D75